jgi:hypothetical protein
LILLTSFLAGLFSRRPVLKNHSGEIAGSRVVNEKGPAV